MDSMSLSSHDFHREDFGKWVAFTAVVLKLFFPRHFPGRSIGARSVRYSNYISIKQCDGTKIGHGVTKPASVMEFDHCLAYLQFLFLLVDGCRMVGDARLVDPAHCGGAPLFRAHAERPLDRSPNMPPHRVLPAARAHPRVGRVQELPHAVARDIQHARDRAPDRVPGLGDHDSLLLMIIHP